MSKQAELDRIADALERIAAALEKLNAPAPQGIEDEGGGNGNPPPGP